MKAGVHFGHQKSKWHPKMKPFIYIEKNGVHIINLEQTQKLLEKALGFIEKTVQNNGTVLFLGTKRQAQGLVKEAALSCDMPYVVTRWLGGTLTNATSVLGLAKKYRKLKEDKASGKLDKFTKKEKLTVTREIERLEDIVGGISKLERIPNVIFVVDVKHEKTAVQEAIRKGVPVVAICDSNVNPDKIDYPIPGNDDATKAIELFVKLVADKINEAKQADTTKNTKNK